MDISHAQSKYTKYLESSTAMQRCGICSLIPSLHGLRGSGSSKEEGEKDRTPCQECGGIWNNKVRIFEKTGQGEGLNVCSTGSSSLST